MIVQYLNLIEALATNEIKHKANNWGDSYEITIYNIEQSKINQTHIYLKDDNDKEVILNNSKEIELEISNKEIVISLI